jgi:hypothetical protein
MKERKQFTAEFSHINDRGAFLQAIWRVSRETNTISEALRGSLKKSG